MALGGLLILSVIIIGLAAMAILFIIKKGKGVIWEETDEVVRKPRYTTQKRTSNKQNNNGSN